MAGSMVPLRLRHDFCAERRGGLFGGDGTKTIGERFDPWRGLWPCVRWWSAGPSVVSTDSEGELTIHVDLEDAPIYGARITSIDDGRARERAYDLGVVQELFDAADAEIGCIAIERDGA